MLKPSNKNIIFLKEFTKELIKSSAPISERLKIQENIEKAGKQLEKQKTRPTTPSIKTNQLIPTKQFMQPKQQFPVPKQPLQPNFQQQFQPQFQPQLKPEQGEFNLGKINPLIKDQAITLIECPGPGKFITVKRINQINITQIKLAEKEISEIIRKFSEKAKIPVIQGTFKAAVGNLIITAIISEFIGSRFIITKITPYSLLEKPQLPQQFPQSRLQKQQFSQFTKQFKP